MSRACKSGRQKTFGPGRVEFRAGEELDDDDDAAADDVDDGGAPSSSAPGTPRRNSEDDVIGGDDDAPRLSASDADVVAAAPSASARSPPPSPARLPATPGRLRSQSPGRLRNTPSRFGGEPEVLEQFAGVLTLGGSQTSRCLRDASTELSASAWSGRVPDPRAAAAASAATRVVPAEVSASAERVRSQPSCRSFGEHRGRPDRGASKLWRNT